MTHIIQKRDLIEMLKPFDDRDKIQIAKDSQPTRTVFLGICILT